MRRSVGWVVATAWLCVFAAGEAKAQMGGPAATSTAPLVEAKRALVAAQAAVDGKGTAALAPHVPALEAALTGLETARPNDPMPVLLYDGVAEQLVVQMWLQTPEAKAMASRSPRLSADPYPAIAYMLGYYYNDIGQPDQAIRVLNAGLRELKTHLDWKLTASAPLLMVEAATAQNAAKRWQAAYDIYREALTLPVGSPDTRPRLYRGLGFSLIEMNRLDEAEAAYRESLKLEPGSAAAKRELDYIADLRRGGPPQAPSMTLSTGKPAVIQ